MKKKIEAKRLISEGNDVYIGFWEGLQWGIRNRNRVRDLFKIKVNSEGLTLDHLIL